jgi:hypothetical protein
MELIPRETSSGDTEYYLIDPENRREVDVKNIVFEEIVNECHWIDEEQTFIEVHYYDWDNSELIAIVNNQGEMLRKSILDIVEYLVEYKLFIIVQLGDHLGEDRFDYMADEEDHLYAVINQFGEYVIEPQPFVIEYNDFDNVFEYGEGESVLRIDVMGKPA